MRLRSLFSRLRNGQSSGILVFCTSIGALSGIYSLLPSSGWTSTLQCALLTASLAAGMGAAWHSGRRVALPSEAVELHPTVWRVTCPCDQRIARQANSMTRPLYEDESIDWDCYARWLAKNPNILCCLTDESGRVIGYFDFLPLNDDAVDGFVNGTSCESSLAPNDILDPASASQGKWLYLAGMAVAGQESYAGKRAARCLVWAACHYLQAFYAAEKWCLLSIASTAEGERLLQRFGFQVFVPAASRTDRHNLYVLNLTDAKRREAARSLATSGCSCELSWDQAPVA